MILKKVEGRRNPRAWHGSRLTVSGLHGHPSTPNPRPKRRVETPGDPWGVPQPPGPSSPAYGTPPTANRWFLPLSSSQWGQTLPTTSVMFPVRIEPRGHAQGGLFTSFAPVFQWCCSTPQGSPGIGRNTFLSSPHLCFIIVFNGDLFVSRDDPLMS